MPGGVKLLPGALPDHITPAAHKGRGLGEQLKILTSARSCWMWTTSGSVLRVLIGQVIDSDGFGPPYHGLPVSSFQTKRREWRSISRYLRMHALMPSALTAPHSTSVLVREAHLRNGLAIYKLAFCGLDAHAHIVHTILNAYSSAQYLSACQHPL